MNHVDGNALAGVLADVFRFDATMAEARCAGCGDLAVVAQALVYESGPGAVVRCRNCGDVLATIVQGDGRLWLSMSGISAIEVSFDTTKS